MRLKNRSIRLRWRQTHPLNGKLSLRIELDGMFTQALVAVFAEGVGVVGPVCKKRRASGDILDQQQGLG